MGKSGTRICQGYARLPEWDGKAYSGGEACASTVGPTSDFYCEEHFAAAFCDAPDCDERPRPDSEYFCNDHYAAFMASGRKTELSYLNRLWSETEERTPAQQLSEQVADLNSRLEAANNDLGRVKGEATRLAAELASAAELATSRAKEIHGLEAMAHEARYVARQLWMSMPAEGKVAYFESGNLWLPEWIKEVGDSE